MDRNDHSLDFEAAKAGQTTDEKRKKAAELYAGLEKARAEMKAYREIKDLLNVFLAEGSEVVHFSFGRGVVILLDGNMLEVNFGGDDDRKFGIESVISKGVITVPDEEAMRAIKGYMPILEKGREEIVRALAIAEKSFAPYAEFLQLPETP